MLILPPPLPSRRQPRPRRPSLRRRPPVVPGPQPRSSPRNPRPHLRPAPMSRTSPSRPRQSATSASVRPRSAPMSSLKPRARTMRMRKSTSRSTSVSRLSLSTTRYFSRTRRSMRSRHRLIWSHGVGLGVCGVWGVKLGMWCDDGERLTS
jgi:hypothetical protein